MDHIWWAGILLLHRPLVVHLCCAPWMDRGTQEVGGCEIHQRCEYSMERRVGSIFGPGLPRLAHTSKTNFSGDSRLRVYRVARESIGVLNSAWKAEELCLPLFHRICRGDVEELDRKGWTWGPDWRQLRVRCPCPEAFFSSWTGPVKKDSSWKSLISSPTQDLTQSSF